MNTVGKFQGFQQKQTTEKVPAKRVADWKAGEELIAFWIEDKTYPGTNYGPCTYHYLIKAEIDKKGNITTNDEMVCLRSGAGLANQLKGLKKGQLVKLVYEGKQRNQKTGMSFHKFTSQVADNYYSPNPTLDLGLEKKQEEDFIDWDD